MKQLGSVSNEEKIQETDLIPYPIQHLFQQKYSAMIEQINREQQRNLLEIERKPGNRIDPRNKLIEESAREQRECEERIEKRSEQRDENLMNVIREMQETKRAIMSAQEEVAAAREKRKAW